MKGDPLETLKKICKKKSHKTEKPAQKVFGQGRDSNPFPSAWQTSKNPQKLEAEEATLVWQLVEASL